MNAIAGYQSVDPDRLDLARSCNATEWQVFTKIRLPSALPFIFAGLNMAGVLCILVVLILLFHDVLQPLTILFALPLSLGGAFVALLVTGKSFSMPSLIGLVMMMGIATKNSILLVDYAIIAMRQGMNRWDALLDAWREWGGREVPRVAIVDWREVVTRGEFELEPKASWRKNRVIPTVNRLMATPTTIWSALNRMADTACTPASANPHATPTTSPTHALCAY